MIKYTSDMNLYLWMIMMFIIFLMILNFLSPVFINILLVTYSIMICLNLSLWKSNFLYSIMIFLSLISGMFIIFMYFSSMISNEQLKIFISPTLFILILMIYYSLNNFMYTPKIIYSSLFKEILPLKSHNLILFDNLTHMFKYPFNYMSILCMIYLLLILLIIVKICSLSSSPLRKIK